jgi:hypothetical protein
MAVGPADHLETLVSLASPLIPLTFALEARNR